MRPITVKSNQTLFDIALQEYGSVTSVVWLVQDNDLYGVTDNIWEGQELLIRSTIDKPRIKEYLNAYEIATRENVIAEGIGYWELENNFVIQ